MSASTDLWETWESNLPSPPDRRILFLLNPLDGVGNLYKQVRQLGTGHPWRESVGKSVKGGWFFWLPLIHRPGNTFRDRNELRNNDHYS